MGFATFLGDMFTGGAVTANKNAQANLDYQKETNAYQKALQQRIFQREDTAVQRRVNDLIAAGLNPNLAAGSAANAGQAIPITTPQQNFVGYGNGVVNFLSNAANVASTVAGTASTFQQIGNTSYNAKKYKELGLPVGYNGLASDALMLLNNGTSIANALLGPEGASALASALTNLSSLGTKGAEVFDRIASSVDRIVSNSLNLFEDYSKGKISFSTLVSRGFGLDMGSFGLPVDYDSGGNQYVPAGQASPKAQAASNSNVGSEIFTDRDGRKYKRYRLPSGSWAREYI